MALPASFPAGTDFADVEGVPVSFEPKSGATTAWDVATGRPFPFDSLMRNGTVMSETAFRFLSERLIYFESHKHDWREHAGQFVVLHGPSVLQHGPAVLGYYATHAEAARAGSERLGRMHFTVLQVPRSGATRSTAPAVRATPAAEAR